MEQTPLGHWGRSPAVSRPSRDILSAVVWAMFSSAPPADISAVCVYRSPMLVLQYRSVPCPGVGQAPLSQAESSGAGRSGAGPGRVERVPRPRRSAVPRRASRTSWSGVRSAE